jgi:hypothetical protein
MESDRYAKRAPSQFRTPEFYFRGGDILKEQEYLREEVRKARAEWQSSKRRLDQLDLDVADATEVLRQREGYTQALASYLEQDVSSAQQEIELKSQLVQLEADIEELQNHLSEVKSKHNPAAPASLQKETGYYLIEIQRGQQEIRQNNELSDERRRQIAACTVHPSYRKALSLEAEIDRLSTKRHNIQLLVQTAHAKMESYRPVMQREDGESRGERNVLRKNIRTRINFARMKERKGAREQKRRARLMWMLTEIEELNERMLDVGLDAEVVETSELRARMHGQAHHEAHEEEEEKREQVFATRASLGTNKRAKWGIKDT